MLVLSIFRTFRSSPDYMCVFGNANSPLGEMEAPAKRKLERWLVLDQTAIGPAIIDSTAYTEK